jgi:hypothetical protein
MPQMTQDEARAELTTMSPEDVDAVHALVSSGRHPSWAIRLVKSQHAQDKARGTDSSPEVPDEEPTSGEKATSFAEGLATSAGAHLAPIAMGLGGAATAPGMDPLDAFKAMYNMQKGHETEAADQAPGAFGAGGLTGDLANAAMGLAGPAKSAATAVEDLASGAKLGDVVSTGLPNIGAAALRAKAAARDALPKKAVDALSSLKTLFGGEAEVAPSQILEETPTSFEMPALPRDARAAPLGS